MFGILYPDCSAKASCYTDKEQVIYQNLVSHFNRTLKEPDSIKYAMMISMKHKYNHLRYSPKDEKVMNDLLTNRSVAS
jgi:hypothetical protein